MGQRTPDRAVPPVDRRRAAVRAAARPPVAPRDDDRGRSRAGRDLRRLGVHQPAGHDRRARRRRRPRDGLLSTGGLRRLAQPRLLRGSLGRELAAANGGEHQLGRRPGDRRDPRERFGSASRVLDQRGIVRRVGRLARRHSGADAAGRGRRKPRTPSRSARRTRVRPTYASVACRLDCVVGRTRLLRSREHDGGVPRERFVQRGRFRLRPHLRRIRPRPCNREPHGWALGRAACGARRLHGRDHRERDWLRDGCDFSECLGCFGVLPARRNWQRLGALV